MLLIKSVLFFALALHQVCGMEHQSYAQSSREIARVFESQELSLLQALGDLQDYVIGRESSEVDYAKMFSFSKELSRLTFDKAPPSFDFHTVSDLDRLMCEIRTGNSLYCEQKPRSCCDIVVEWARYAKQSITSLFDRSLLLTHFKKLTGRFLVYYKITRFLIMKDYQRAVRIG